VTLSPEEIQSSKKTINETQSSNKATHETRVAGNDMVHRRRKHIISSGNDVVQAKYFFRKRHGASVVFRQETTWGKHIISSGNEVAHQWCKHNISPERVARNDKAHQWCKYIL
jgi:hypothetical protein